MSQTCSPSTQRRYGLARGCRTWEVARSTVYLHQARAMTPAPPPRRRGPQPRWSDEALLEKIRAGLAASPVLGEGQRKVWARLRWEAGRPAKGRVLRLMREAKLLAHAAGPRPWAEGARRDDHHRCAGSDGGMDATSCMTRREGTATVFVVVDHCAAECIGIHAARPGTRFEAVEPLRQGVHAIFGAYAERIATGLQARHDHGSQYVSDYFQDELRFLGIDSSPAFVREPEGNGVAERFIRTLKEQLLWVRTFDTVEELRQALLEFKERYNREWLCERHRHQTPAAVRARTARCHAAA